MLLEIGDNKWCVIKTVDLWQSVTVIRENEYPPCWSDNVCHYNSFSV